MNSKTTCWLELGQAELQLLHHGGTEGTAISFKPRNAKKQSFFCVAGPYVGTEPSVPPW